MYPRIKRKLPFSALSTPNIIKLFLYDFLLQNDEKKLCK